MSTRKEQLKALDRLLTIMDELREQCPWDRKQTFESLRHLTIEETYELADAILDKDHKAMEGELGDLLLHVFFYAKIGSESGAFDMATVANAISEKLINRHPHIYGDLCFCWPRFVLQEWGWRRQLAVPSQQLTSTISLGPSFCTFAFHTNLWRHLLSV